ncbi:Ion transport domain-containing protein [Hirschfeldia incana]|nr:Ion transport domain-containing protein [Hirschfeldia incana]
MERSSKSARGRLKKAYITMKTPENWRKIILFVCVVALGIDPLYLFVPVVDSPKFCFTFDKKLAIGVSVLRTFIDVIYVVHIIWNFMRYANGENNLYSKPIWDICFIFHTIVDILSVLPIPQVLVLTLMRRSDSLVSRTILKWIILAQYIPRILRIYPLYKKVTRAFGTVSETKWVGAALNLFLYMLHSHVFGAFWYVSSVEKLNKCWRLACPDLPGCNLKFQYCGREGGNNIPYGLNISCPLIEPDQITNSSVFNFGMYIDALKSGIVEVNPDDFPRKFFYCFWWGLRNISALGQNLRTSNSVGEIVFALIICVSGLLLFAVLIGNIQKYLESNTTKIDEKLEQKRVTEHWMSSKRLPRDLKRMIRKHEDDEWKKNTRIDDEAILHNLPEDIRLRTELHINVSSLYPC